MARIKVVILGIGIAIVLAFFFGYGIDTFYKSQKYEDFCGEIGELKTYSSEEACKDNGGKWIEHEKLLPIEKGQYLCTKGPEKDGAFTFNCEVNELERDSGHCESDYYCREEFDDSRQVYNRNVFVMCIVLGLFGVIAGTYLKLPSVSAGIMGGGVLTIIYGSLRYWADMNEYIRFTILSIALAILIWVGYKKFKK